MSVRKAGDLPHISLTALRKLIHELAPEELAKLPIEKLPENIPEDIVEEAPFYSRGAVESLIMEANTYHLSLRVRLQQTMGGDAVAAIDHAHHAGATANVRVFRTKLMELIALRQNAAQSDRPPDLRNYGAHIKRLNDLLIDVRTEQANTLRLEETLRTEAPSDPALQPTVQRAQAQLRRAAGEVNQLLGQFFVVRLQFARQEMSRKRAAAEAMQERRETIRLQLQELSSELQSGPGFFARALRRRQHKEQKEQTQADIARLMTDFKTAEIAISENDLLGWLDTVVDASLHPQAREYVRELLTQSRTLLYSLLNHYCVTQEEAARQIAANPFLQVDPQNAIRYVLKSEEFILKYFARKREQANAWLSSAAQIRIDDLDMLERDLIQELRRSSRF